MQTKRRTRTNDRRKTEFWVIIKDFPPPLVRLMARTCENDEVRGISDQEVAIGSGLTLERVREIAYMKNWDTVTIDEMRRFFAGCNFDPCKSRDRNRACAYNRSAKGSPSFRYLRNTPHWQDTYMPLIQHFKKCTIG